MKTSDTFRPFLAITLGYWCFMLTDGALRMIVLLHFHEMGLSPLNLANLFLIYEFVGILTNISAGYLAKRFGLKSTLYTGMLFQIFALLLLSIIPDSWAISQMIFFVALVQAVSGIAKDLTKTSSKSSVKLLAPANNNSILFFWVARLTGSKNAIKGLGFFVGCALIATLDFSTSLIILAVLLSIILATIALLMPKNLHSGSKGVKFNQVFSKNRKINILSVARLLLFGARDVWFVLGIPLYFFEAFSDGSQESNKFVFFGLGAFMSLWVIFYGLFQYFAPRFFKDLSSLKIERQALNWVTILIITPAILFSISSFSYGLPKYVVLATIIIGLFVFGAIFAVNSSLHSFLILNYTNNDRVTMDVGYYYMANASGRLVGTFLSGFFFQLGGLSACLFASSIMLCLASLATFFLKTSQETLP